MRHSFLMSIFLVFSFSNQASQWKKVSVFSRNGIIGYLAQSVKNNETLFIVRFGAGNYSGIKIIDQTVVPLDCIGQPALKETFNNFKQLLESNKTAKARL